MIIACPSCKKKFEVNASLIPKEGKMLQCGSCSHKWFFKKEVIKKVIKTVDKTPEIIDKNVPDSTEELITEAETAISNFEKKNIKSNKKINFLSFLIIFIITLVAIIILADTFKNFIKIFIPGFDVILSHLYESLKDIMLFLRDLLK